MKLVVEELKGLTEEMIALTGFSVLDIEREEWQDQLKKSLTDDFIIPPFSYWDTRQKYWQERKRVWQQLFGDSRDGRDDDLMGEGLKTLAMLGSGKSNLTGTSEFDPIVAEICYRWFCPQDGKILDPFAGGAVRGAVAGVLGYNYTGVDLSPSQIADNTEKVAKLQQKGKVEYILGNSVNLPSLVTGEFDYIFSCPPYYDLEIYSEDEEDLSNKGTYEDFIKEYREVIKKAVDKLKPNRFATFIVGDIRDDKGF